MDILRELDRADNSKLRNEILHRLDGMAPALPNKVITNDDLEPGEPLRRAFVSARMSTEDKSPGNPDAYSKVSPDAFTAVVPAGTILPSSDSGWVYSGGGHPDTLCKVIRTLLAAVAARVPADADILEPPQIYLKVEAWQVYVLAWATFREAK